MNCDTSIRPFEFGMGETFDDVRQCLPPRLFAFAEKSQDLLGIDARTAAMGGLAHLAAAMGRGVFLDDGTTRIPPCFSLAVISDSTSPGEWLATLGRGWLEEAKGISNFLTSDQAKLVLHRHLRDAAAQDTNTRSSDPQIDLLVNSIPLDALKMVHTQYLTTRTDPTAAGLAIVQNSGRTTTMINGARDPLIEWGQLKPIMQRQLNEMLILGWLCKPMPVTPKRTEIPASLTCLWQTRTQSLQQTWYSNRSICAHDPPPVLLFKFRGAPKRLPDVNAPEFADWEQLLKIAFQCRRVINGASDIALEQSVKVIAELFYKQFDSATATLPKEMQPWLQWIPDLVLRMYHLQLIAHSLEQTIVATAMGKGQKQPTEFTIQQKQQAMMSAVRLTRWAANEHFQVLLGFMGKSEVARLSTGSDNTDTQRLEEGILQKLKDNGPQSPRELQRSFHELRAQPRDEALRRLKSKGAVTQDLDGKLEVAA